MPLRDLFCSKQDEENNYIKKSYDAEQKKAIFFFVSLFELNGSIFYYN
jgi:hypothetical protein